MPRLRIGDRLVEAREGGVFERLRNQVAEVADAGERVASDSEVGVGEGELALIVTGSTAKQTEATKGKNIDATIIAKVDRINLEK